MKTTTNTTTNTNDLADLLTLLSGALSITARLVRRGGLTVVLTLLTDPELARALREALDRAKRGGDVEPSDTDTSHDTKPEKATVIAPMDCECLVFSDPTGNGEVIMAHMNSGTIVRVFVPYGGIPEPGENYAVTLGNLSGKFARGSSHGDEIRWTHINKGIGIGPSLGPAIVRGVQGWWANHDAGPEKVATTPPRDRWEVRLVDGELEVTWGDARRVAQVVTDTKPNAAPRDLSAPWIIDVFDVDDRGDRGWAWRGHVRSPLAWRIRWCKSSPVEVVLPHDWPERFIREVRRWALEQIDDTRDARLKAVARALVASGLYGHHEHSLHNAVSDLTALGGDESLDDLLGAWEFCVTHPPADRGDVDEGASPEGGAP